MEKKKNMSTHKELKGRRKLSVLLHSSSDLCHLLSSFKLHNTAMEKAGLHKYKEICCEFNPARLPSSRAFRMAADLQMLGGGTQSSPFQS